MSRSVQNKPPVVACSLEELPDPCKPAELAAALRISVSLIYHEIGNGRLPAIRLGKGKIRPAVLLIERKDIATWLEKCKGGK